MTTWIVEATVIRQKPENLIIGVAGIIALSSMPTILRADNGLWKEGQEIIEGVDFGVKLIQTAEARTNGVDYYGIDIFEKRAVPLSKEENKVPVRGTDSEIKALAEDIALNWGVYYTESGEVNHNVISAMMEMYKAALSGIEEAVNNNEWAAIGKLVSVCEEALEWLQNTNEGRSIPQIDGQPGTWMNKMKNRLSELSKVIHQPEPSTERVECYLPCSKEEASQTPRSELTFSNQYGWLKKTTLTVVNPSKS